MFGDRFWWAAYTVLGALAAGSYFLLPEMGAAAVYILVGASSAAAVAFGVFLHRPPRRLPWFLISCGPLLMSLADVLWSYYYWFSKGGLPFPSPADAAYLLGYLFLWAGLILLQRRVVGNGLDTVVDPLMVATGAGLLYWGLIIGPYVHDPGLSFVAKAVSVSYPLLDVLLLAALARYLFGFNGRVPALYLLAAGFAAHGSAMWPGGILPAAPRTLALGVWRRCCGRPRARSRSERLMRQPPRAAGTSESSR